MGEREVMKKKGVERQGPMTWLNLFGEGESDRNGGKTQISLVEWLLRIEGAIVERSENNWCLHLNVNEQISNASHEVMFLVKNAKEASPPWDEHKAKRVQIKTTTQFWIETQFES